MEHTAGIVDATASRHGNAISDPPSTTTISTVAVQAGKAKIVLAILRSNEWIRVRIQQMEPDLMEVGSTLEEAKALRREHDELLMKLNLKQKDVTELLARADDLASQNKSYQEVYTAMAHSLGEAWKDLNTQLEYRKMLLDQSIAFHQSALQFSHRMEEAQCRFDQTGLAQDVETARRQLQQHTDIKKSILESSMSTLQEGQSLLDRIREMGMRADVQNRHATTAACYGIEHLLELLQDRRRRLEELWVQRRVKLEQCLQLLLLDTEVNKISEWFTSSGDVYLSKKDLGDSAAAAHQLTEEHYRFEAQAKEIHENVLRLVRTADQLVHSDLKNAEGVRQRLKTIDDKCEQFMHKMDYRRKNVTMATQFFTLAQAALMKLNNIEVDLSRTDLPRNSAALAEKHAQFSTAIVEHSTPALREGRILLERVGRNDPSSQGVLKMVTDLQEKCTKLEEMCKARYEAGEKSQAFNQFQEKYTTLSSWLVQIGQATLRNRGDLGIDVYTAKDFVELHERLAKDLTDKVNEVRGLSEAAEALATSGDTEGGAAKERALALHQQWELVQTTVAIRIKLALSYVHFHKKAQSLAIKMDALEQYLKIEKMDAAAITEAAIKHKEQKWTDVSHNYKDVENQGKDFIKKAADVKKDEELDTRRAVAVVESILQMFIERMGTVTDYYEHWKVHVSTGKEFKTQWAQFVAEARKTIDWVRKSEKDFFVPFIAGKLGKTAEEVKKSLSKMEAFMPTVKKAQADIEEHLKTAEMLSLKGDTHGQKDQIINELLKVHTRFQARINEYQVLLNMTVKFFTNLNQLDKLIEKTEKEFSTADLPKEVDKARLMLREHESNRERMSELISFTTEEGEQIVIRVRQQDSEALAKDEVQKVLQMTEERRHAWEQRWEDHRNRLEQNLQVAQFYFDLRQIHQELDELNRQLDARHGNYGSSLSSVKMTSDAFKQFEASAKVIEDKVNTFVATAGHMIRQEHYDSRRIRVEVDQVQKKWHEFVGRVSEYRTHLDESTKFFELLEEADNFFHDASQFLLQVGRKATSCKTSAEADDLIKDLDKYRTEGAAKQDDKLGQMYRYIVNLYGQVQGPPKMQPTVEKNQEILDSFLKAMKELGILRDNLLKKEQILAEMDAVVESKAPRVPVFSQPLQNTEIKEGQKFTFHCRLECDGEPKIEWFKDDLPITSPDYQQTYKDGMASLTIEETFSEDTAKYMCKATTPFGQAETTAYLKVKETHRKIIAPDFIKHIKSSEIPEGTQFMFECAVSGTPSPTISWFKDDVNIDNSPEYIITKINGTCCLKIRKAQKEQTGRYTCKAANQGGEAATSAKLNVLGVKKPHFHEPLKNVTCAEGKSVRLECKFTGEPTPTIHWMRNDVGIMPSGVFKVIVEANYTALEITEVYPEDAGTFSVLAKNIGGETRTSCVLVVEGMFSTTTEPEEVVEPQAPKFVQPLKNKDVMEGSRARLDCVITGQPEPEVIWYHNEKPVKESKDFQLLFEGDRCSLIIREVYLEDSGDYKCVARNPHGMADSKCRLIVEPLSELSDASATSAPADVVPPKFTQLLKDLEGVEGRQVRFDCRVIGHPTPEIKWFREHTEIKNSADFQISMHRELHSLTIPEVFKEDSGNFMCRAVNMAGEAKCYASLVVKPAMDAHVVKTRLIEEAHTVVKVPTAVGITHQGPDFKTVFSDLRVKAGEPCKFDVTIHGNPRPRVRWLFNNEPIVSPDYQISCFGDVYSLYIPEVFDEDAGRFSIIAENDSGKATCSALLEVVDESAAPPLMPAPPGARERTPYSPAPKAKKEEPIQVKVAAAPVAMAAPAAPPPPPQSYSTEMVVPNKQAFKPVDIVVEVPVPPRFVEPLKNISVEEGTRVTLEGMVDGKPEPTVKWYKAGKEISNTPDFQVSFRNKRVTLTIPEVFPEDAGPYECIARNEAGISRSTADIVVKASATAPEFLDRLTTREVKEGESVRFTIRVMGKPAPEVTWYREGSQIISSPDFEIIKDGETSSLYIPEVFYEDSGKFSVKAENPGGVNTCTAELIVEAPSAMEESASPSPPVSRSPSVGHSPERGQYRPGIPKPGSSREPTPLKDQRPVQFSKPLQDTTVREGQRAVLECIINPYPEPQRVQWFRNEIEIFTSPDYQISYSHGICTLIISEVFPEDAGKFSCTITINNIPSTTHMYLTVDPGVPQQPLMAPLFEIKITNQPLNYGQTAYFECKVQGYPPPEILWTRRGHPLVDKTRYKSTYDQYSGITTLTILNLRDEDEGEYTCTALNTEGECSTSAMLLAPAHYQDWLRQEQGLPPAPTPAKSPRVVSELPEKRLEPTPMQMAPPPAPQYSEPDGFKVSHFEKVLEQEVAYRDGRVDPHGMQLPSDAEEAFDANAVEACPPRIEQRLSNFKLMEGSDATFVCLVSGHPRPTVQWFHNGRNLKPGNRYEMRYTREGYCTLRIRVAFPEDEGYYTVCATNVMGRDMCSAELYIEELSRVDDTSYVAPEALRKMTRAPGQRRGSEEGGVAERYFKPVFRKIPADEEVQEGALCRFDCLVSGRPMPEIYWYRDNEQVLDTSEHKIVVKEDGVHSLIIEHVAPHDAGLYTCIAQNRGGEDRFQVRLNVKARQEAYVPQFTERLKNVTCTEGDNITLFAEAHGVPPPMLSWSKDGRILDRDDNYKITTQGGSSWLQIPCVRKLDSTWFQCNAVNIAGSAANRVKIMVQPAPKKVEPPKKLVITRRGMTPTKRYRSQSPTTPKAPAAPFQPITPSAVSMVNIPMNVRDFRARPAPPQQRPRSVSPMVIDLARPAMAPVQHTPSTPSTAEIMLMQPPLVRPEPVRPVQSVPQPPAQAPRDVDMYDPNNPQAPQFRTKPQSLENIQQGQPAQFDCRLAPIGDPSMKVEWFKDGKILRTGHRFKPVYDFGHCSLEILYAYPEDSGTYMVVAMNECGKAEEEVELDCFGDPSVDEETQLPEGMQSMPQIQSLEHAARKPMRKQLSSRPNDAPPVFDLMPEPVKCEEGDCAKFRVKISGFPRPRLTWWVNGAMVMNAPRFKLRYDGMMHYLEIPKCREYDAGVVRVVAKNPLGEAECTTQLTVIPQDDWRSRLKQAPKWETVKQTESPPEFFVQMRDLEIRVGDPATFDCQISGYPRPDFYWTKNGQRLSESTRWKFIVEEDHYTLLIYEVHHEDQGRYECIAQNALGKATCTANLQVDGQMTVELRATAPVDTAGQAPTLLEPMRDQKVDEGSQAHFRCRMVGSPEPVVQWYYNNQVIKPSKYFQMYSSNGTYTLTLAGAFPEDEGIYKCTARNQAGEVTCIAHLKVNSLSGAETQVERGAPPSFSKPISGQQVKPGQDARFEVTVAGQPGKVTWFCESRQVTQDNRHQIFQQGQTFVLLVKNCTPQDVGAYTCRISNPAGVAECSAPLYIDGVQAKAPPPAQKQPPRAPQILKAPSPVREVAVGNTTKLVVQLAAYPPPRYAWYFNNQQIQQSQRVKQSYDNGSVTLIIYNVQAQDSGDYVLKAKNDLGECTWKTTLHIHPSEKIVQLPGQKVSVGAPEEVAKDMAPTFTQPLPPETTVNESSTARLEAHVKGKPMPKVQWLVNGLEIKPSPKYSITWEGDRSVLLIKNITKDDTAIYAIRAVNDLGEAVSSTTLYVIPAEKRLAEADPPRFILPLQSCEAFDGEEVILTCNVVGRPKPEVSWFHNDKCIDVSEDFVLNYNRETGKCDCVIVECLPDDQGVFRCVARNDAGQAKTECKLTWKAAPPKPTKEEAVKPDATAVVQAKVQAAPLEEKKVKVVKREEFTVDGENRLDTETVTTTETKTVKKLVKKDSGQAPRFTRPIQPQVVREGETATFNAITSGAPQPEVMWLKDKKEMKPNDRIKMHYNKDTSLCELVIQKANQSDVGVYSCRASNTAGKATCTANVVVVPPDAEVTVTEKTMSVKKEKVTIVGDEETRVTETSPNYTQQLPSALDAAIGSNVRLECRIEGLPEPQISWTFNGQIIQPSKRREMTCTNHVCTLVITQVGRMDSGDYVCRAVNSLGEATTKCTLRVGAPAQNGIPQPVPQPGTGSSHPVGAPIVPQMTPSVQSRPGDLAPEVPPAPLTEPCAVIPGQVPHMPVGAEMTATINLSGGADISTRYQQQSVNIQQTSSMIGQPRATFQQQTSYTGAHMSRSTARPITLQGPRPASLDSIRPSTLEGKVQAAYSANLNRPHSLEGRVQAAYKLKQDAPPQPTTLEGRVQTAYRMNSTGMSPVEPEMSSTYQTSVFQSSTAYSSMSGVQQQEQFQQQVSTGLTRSISTSSTSYQRREVSSGRSTPIRISSRQTTPVRSGRTTPVRSGRSTPTMQEPPRFTQPLRDITINDGDKVVFRVMWRGIPRPTINWYFNSEPIIPSDDFLIKIDIQRGESTLTIKEVFPDDEGEYMCKAESTLGAAVTHCHLFVRLPSSSEEDIQEVVSRSKDVLRVQESLHLKERSSFSETISIETQKRFKEFQMQFQIPDRKAERTEILMRQQAALRGMRMDVNVDLPVPKTEVQTKTMHLQKTIDVKPSMQKHLAYLNLPLEQQRRFSETIAIDQSRPRPDPVQVTFSLPEQRRRLEKSAIQIRQQAALRGMKMEVEIAESRRQTTKCEFQTKKRAEAVSTKRQEFHMQLEGAPPHFTIDLTSAKVMDGEEVKFNACVTGNPMPEVTWYKNGKVIVENPDFRTTYSKKTGVCTLHILEVFPQDTGEYRCIAVNQYGRAVTGATLQVDVFEYVPDSEEASASAAESLPDRIVSEDEAEFLERTQAFIANMQKLRQELQEEQVREEEVIMTEEYNEETVQMADVKWQIPKKAVTMEIEIPEQVASEMQSHVMEEVTQEKRVTVEMVQPIVQVKKEQMATQQLAPLVAEEITEVVQEERTETTQEQRIDVALATHRVEAQPTMQARHIVSIVKPETVAEHPSAPSPEAPLQEEIKVELQQPVKKPVQEARVQPQMEHLAEEHTAEFTAEVTTDLVDGQQVQVELAQIDQVKRRESMAMPIEEHLQPEIIQEILERVPSPEESQQQQVQVEMMSHQVDTAKESLAIQQVKVVKTEEVVESLERVPTPMQSEQLHVEQIALVQHIREQPKESMALPMEEVTQAEVVFESAERVPSPEESQQQHVTVELSQHVVEGAVGALVHPTEEVTQAEMVGEAARVPSPEASQEEHVVVELSSHMVEQATTSLVQPLEEMLHPEIVMESLDRVPTPEGAGEERVQVMLSTTQTEEAKQSLVQPVQEMLSPEMVEESLDRVPSPEGAGEERVEVMLSTTETVQAKQSLVQPIQEVVTPEMLEECKDRIPTPEGAGEEQVQVLLEMHQKEAAMGAMVMPVEEVTMVEVTDESRERIPTPEGAGEQQVQVQLAMQQTELAKGSMVMPIEEVTMVEVTDESRERIPTPEGAGEQHVQVQLEMQQTELAKGSMVMPVEEVTMVEVTDESKERIPTPEGAGEQHVQVQLEIQQTELAKGSMVMPVEEVTQVEVTDESREYIPTPEGAGEQQVQVQLEIQQTEEAKGALVMPVEEITQVEVTDESKERIPTPEGAGEQHVQVQLEIQQTEEARGAMVMPVEEVTQVEVTDESKERIPTPEGAGEEHVYVDLDRGWIMDAEGAMVMPQTELLPPEEAQESLDRVPTPEGAGEEKVIVDLGQSTVEAAKGALVMPLMEILPPEVVEESRERVPTPEGAGEEHVKVPLGQHAVEAAKGAMVQPQEERMKEEDIMDILDRMPSPVETQEQRVVVPLDQPDVAGAKEHYTGFVEERHSEEEEEDIFFEAAEPAPEGKEVKVDLGYVYVQDREMLLTETQHAQIEAIEAGEANAEYTEEDTYKEQVQVALEEAQKQPAKPSLVDMQEQVISPLQAEDLNVEEVWEETSQEKRVEVPLGMAEKEAAKGSLVGHTDEVVEVQMTREDIEELREETSRGGKVHVQMDSAWKAHRPLQLAGPVAEQVQPELIASQYDDSIKEMRMIPTYVQPEYEPAVLEWFRLEIRVHPRGLEIMEEEVAAETRIEQSEMSLHEMQLQLERDQQILQESCQMSATQFQTETQRIQWRAEAAAESHLAFQTQEVRAQTEAQMRMMSAQMESQVIRAAQEITEEREVVTETTREEIEVIKRPVIEETVQQEVQERVRTEIKRELMAPAFEIPLSDITVTDGERATFECKVTGFPRPQVTWYVDSQEIKITTEFRMEYTIEGYVILIISDVLAEDEGEYMVKAVNEAGTCTTTAYLTVLPPERSEPASPMVETQMMMQKRMEDENIMDEWMEEWTEERKIQWTEQKMMQQRMVEEQMRQQQMTQQHMAQQQVVLQKPQDETWHDESWSDERVVEESYRQMQLDISMQSQKQTAVVEVPIPTQPEAPSFVKMLEHKEVFETMDITFECHVTGNPEPKIIWRKDGKKIEMSQRIEIFYYRGVATLTIRRVTIEDEGEYTCEVYNEWGVCSSSAELLVEKLLHTIEQVILEELYEIEIEMLFKWRATAMEAFTIEHFSGSEIIRA